VKIREVKIREANENDAAALAKIECDIWKTNYKHIFSVEVLEKEMKPDVHTEKFEKLLRKNDKNSVFFVAENQKNIVGYVLILVKRNCARDNENSIVGAALKKMEKGQALLGLLHVAPEEQGKGIGTRLLDYAKNYLQGNKLRTLTGHCFFKDEQGTKFHMKTGARVKQRMVTEVFGEKHIQFRLELDLEKGGQ